MRHKADMTPAEVGEEFVVGIKRGMKNAYTTNGIEFCHQPAGQNVKRPNLRPLDTLVSGHHASFLDATPSSRCHHYFSSPPSLSPLAVVVSNNIVVLGDKAIRDGSGQR